MYNLADMERTGTRLILWKDEYKRYLASLHWLLIQELLYAQTPHRQRCWQFKCDSNKGCALGIAYLNSSMRICKRSEFQEEVGMLNRRQLLMLLGSSAVSVSSGSAALALQTSDASPTPSKKPKSIELAPGLRLFDYRIVEHPDRWSVFRGELINDTDFPADTPELIQTFYDADDNILGENRVYSAIGALRPHERDYLVNSGDFVQFDAAPETYDHFTVSLERGVDDWPSNIQLQYTYDIGLTIAEEVEKTVTRTSYGAVIDAINESDHEIYGGFLISAFLDSNKRFIGYAREEVDSTIPPGKKVRFRTYVDNYYWGSFSPFLYLEEEEKFYVRTAVIGKAYQ
jgi:hypothetical protein